MVAAITDNIGIFQGTVTSHTITDDTIPTISGTISAALASGENLRVFNDTTFLGLANVNNDTFTWEFTPTTTLPNTAGTAYTISARVADAAGNLGSVSTIGSFTLDTTAPTTTSAVTAITDNVGIFTVTVATGSTTDDTSL